VGSIISHDYTKLATDNPKKNFIYCSLSLPPSDSSPSPSAFFSSLLTYDTLSPLFISHYPFSLSLTVPIAINYPMTKPPPLRSLLPLSVSQSVAPLYRTPLPSLSLSPIVASIYRAISALSSRSSVTPFPQVGSPTPHSTCTVWLGTRGPFPLPP
jgi:hypothetical protein